MPAVAEIPTIRRPNRLRELRESMGITQSEMARRLSIKISTLNRHEKQNRGLDALSIERYALFFGVNAYELFVPDDHELEYEIVDSDSLES